MGRLENLVGAYSLTMVDRMVAAGVGAGTAASEQGALVTLAKHPDRPVSWLGGVLGLTSSGITRLVDRLVAAGWVARTPGPDSRQRRLRLTDAGKRRARDLLRARQEALAESLDGLSTSDRVELELLLDRLVSGLASSRLPALQTCRLCDRAACAADGRHCPLEHTVAVGDPYA